MKISPMEVSLIGSFGTDLTVVNAARVSFAKESVFEKDSETGNEKLSERDSRLIKYLADHKSKKSTMNSLKYFQGALKLG